MVNKMKVVAILVVGVVLGVAGRAYFQETCALRVSGDTQLNFSYLYINGYYDSGICIDHGAKVQSNGVIVFGKDTWFVFGGIVTGVVDDTSQIIIPDGAVLRGSHYKP